MARVRTWEQPQQPIASRWREGEVTWAHLACGHEEPATGLDLSTSLRCQQCNPVMKRLELHPPASGVA